MSSKPRYIQPDNITARDGCARVRLLALIARCLFPNSPTVRLHLCPACIAKHGIDLASDWPFINASHRHAPEVIYT